MGRSFKRSRLGVLAFAASPPISYPYHICDTQGDYCGAPEMGKTGYITARVEPKLKASASRILRRVGLSTSDAITLFLKQVILQGGLPFEVRVPNAQTGKATAELEAGGGKNLHRGPK